MIQSRSFMRLGNVPQPEPEPPPSKVVPPPAGYEIRRVLPWDDPQGIMVSYTYDTTLRDAIGQFAVVELYITGKTPTDPAGTEKWLGNWGAVTVFNRLTHADMMQVARAQVQQFGLIWSDSELIANEKKPLPDGWTLKQKMGWLYQPLESFGGKPGLVMWGVGEWFETTEARYGTMVNAGQRIAVSQQVFTFRVRMPGRFMAEDVRMRKLLAFRRSDWGKTHVQYPYLMQKATTADFPSNRYGEAPKGMVMCPVALDAQDFDFAGSFQPATYYMPEVWLEGT